MNAKICLLIVLYLIDKTNGKDDKRTMKTIKPKQIVIINNKEIVPFVKENVECNVNSDSVIKDEPTETIEDLMNNVLKENNYIQREKEKEKEINPNLIKVEFYLTKRQYDLYTKKGGESWLKKALVGQGNKKRK